MDQDKKFFLIGKASANLAHELRKPLAVILTYIQFCQSKLPLDDRVRERLNFIEYNVKRMASLINNFMDFSRPNKLNISKVNVEDIINTALVNNKAYLEQIKVKKKIQKLPDIMGDYEKLEQVLTNIIYNAIDSMEGKGAISIKASSAEGAVRLEVQDTGKGMRPEDVSRVFEPFFSNKKEGIGLGLAIARDIVELHKGSIRARSEQGKGASIIVDLPVGK